MFAALVSLLSAPAAHARPSVALTDAAARAGDAVHFSISGVDGWGVAYHFEIDDEDVLDGRSGTDVSGAFTMPDLGEDATTALLDAEIWWSDRKRTVKLRLEYLGEALPAPKPAAPLVPSTVADAAPQAVSPPPPPASSPSPALAAPSKSGAAPKSQRRQRKRHKPRGSESRRRTAGNERRTRRTGRRHDRRRADRRAKHKRPKRRYRHIRGFYDGYAEPGAQRTGDGRGALVLNAIAPRTAGVAAAVARPSTGVSAALIVPVVLALASLALAGTALLRKRRLGARG